MSDLHDDLTEISGVGDATADKILDTLENHDMGDGDPLLEKAKTAAKEENTHKAIAYLKRL